MTSTRRHRSAVSSWSIAACLALLGCGAPSATAAGGVTASPQPSASAPAPLAQPSPVAAPPSAAPANVPPTAQPPTEGAELAEGDEDRGRHHGGVLMLIVASIKDLDLRPDQRTTVDKIRSDLLAKMEPARAAGKDLANTLADGVAAGAVDRAKADSAINKLVVQVQGLHEASLNALNELHAALSAPQRAALVDDLQSHWERWKEAHGRDEQDEHQHRSGYLLALVGQLRLTKEQAEKIKAAFHERMKAGPQDHLHKEVQDHLQGFASAFKGDAFNAKSLTGARAADGHMARWGATRRARFLETAAPALAPEQRTRLSQMIRDDASRAEP
jgi:Spy/CpxP family protein refolding chaperone